MINRFVIEKKGRYNMSSAVVFDSKTGNTKLVAQWIAQNLRDCVYCGDIKDCEEKGAEVFFVGFWTDKGSCTEKVKEFLQGLHGKRIYIFGTAGFGVSEEYFQKILGSVKNLVPQDNSTELLFMCQGKMPVQVRERYVKMLDDPEKALQAQMLIKNFDMALSHPDEEDKRRLLEKLSLISL